MDQRFVLGTNKVVLPGVTLVNRRFFCVASTVLGGQVLYALFHPNTQGLQMGYERGGCVSMKGRKKRRSWLVLRDRETKQREPARAETSELRPVLSPPIRSCLTRISADSMRFGGLFTRATGGKG